MLTRCKNRQPEMAIKIEKQGNNYISETTTVSIDISTTNLAFMTTESSKKVSVKDCYTANDNRK